MSETCPGCAHPATEHTTADRCVRFVHDPSRQMLVRCDCLGLPYARAQAAHEQQMADDPAHDKSPCVCCCMDCPDLEGVAT